MGDGRGRNQSSCTEVGIVDENKNSGKGACATARYYLGMDRTDAVSDTNCC